MGASTDAAACTKAWTSDNSSVIEITDAATGAYTAVGRGTAKITYTITPDDDVTYAPVYVERNVSVTAPVVITANDVVMTYGDAPTAIGATTSDGYAGTLSYESASENVATIDGSGNVTIVNAGLTTITINATANAANLYTASSKVINVTVNQPAGGTTAKPATDVITLDFTDNSGWGFPAGSSNKTTAEGSFTSGGYTVKLAGGGSGNGYYYHSTDKYLLMGKSGATLTLPAFSYPVTKIEVVGKSGASTGVNQNIYVGETSVSTASTGATGTNTYSINSSYQTAGTIYTLKVTSAHNTQITVIKVTVDKGSVTIPVTLNASGYATYCSEYPLDFTDYKSANYSAWQITDINSSTNEITFSQIKGKVKGGTGIFLMGQSNGNILLTSSDCSIGLDDNLLEGTLVPTYVAANTYYGLSGNNFVKINAGIVPAGKAILDASWVSASRLSFVFEDEPSGINNVNHEAITDNRYYDLQGRRVMQPTKGLYIVNGKKILAK